MGCTWSLRVEWIFYALMAVLIGFRLVKYATWVLAGLVALDAAGLPVGQAFLLFLIGVVAYRTSRERFEWDHAVGLYLAVLDLVRTYGRWKGKWWVVWMLLGFAGLLFAASRWRMVVLANRCWWAWGRFRMGCTWCTRTSGMW